MRFKRLFTVIACISLCLGLTGCVSSNGLPITDDMPSMTLPPAEVSYAAPIGDAALEYSETAVLYLPSYDGISLTPVETTVSYSLVRPRAESLVRALLSHAGTKTASSLGGDVRLSLHGISPVEVSRNVVTVNLSASALQLDREALYLACQAIANTLTELEEIEYVNILVVDKPVGVDVANTLPMGAFKHSDATDLGAVYEQALSRRVGTTESVLDKPFSANITLYFPLTDTRGMVSEVQTMSFENQLLSDMVIAILRKLSSGPESDALRSPALPLLADLMTSKPVLRESEETGGNIIVLDFAHNLDDMLDAYGISRDQCLASLCYTFSTFFPNVSGVSLSINGTPVDELLLTENDEETQAAGTVVRSDFSDRLYDFCTLYFPDETGILRASLRPVAYYQARNPRFLLTELAKGPQACDSASDLRPIMKKEAITDTALLGFSLTDCTLLVNFSPAFEEIGHGMDGDSERALAYAMVNTLCVNPRIRSVCFFQAGSQFDGFSGEIYWRGLFYPMLAAPAPSADVPAQAPSPSPDQTDVSSER